MMHIIKCEDRDEVHMLSDPAYASELFNLLGDGKEVLVKGERLAMCRFHSIVLVLQHLLPIWQSRLLFWVYLGKVLGYIGHLSDCLAVNLGPVGHDSTAGASSSSSSMQTQRNEALSKIRSTTKNTIHFATRILVDTDWHRRSRLGFYLRG